ncbi:ACP phosphodiesterase [Rhabdobacter roseus]|uniref:Acyl carrier protein phosphodiesterase n=1 Tax=Rhabdobacter roseus TaxID=1655419 RepID=A0A840TPM6_9BACT|nr:ACP phosphodiesterase [Rhabdobacter roseus]MBB5283183.1 acyl carrier protein phosphodiesterase [Rhabdobacter roseus]
MNFLAHLLLSGTNEEIILGNFVADFIKGRLTDEKTRSWHPDFLLGVRLHRFIDSYTDAHPVVRDMKRRIAVQHGKTAGVAGDIYFDHFLALDFNHYNQVPFSIFVDTMYALIQQKNSAIPQAMRPMAQAMIQYDWLRGYRSIDGIRRSLDGLSRRFAFMQDLRGAEKELLTHFDYYHTAFKLFFPELMQASALFILQHQDHHTR